MDPAQAAERRARRLKRLQNKDAGNVSEEQVVKSGESKEEKTRPEIIKMEVIERVPKQTKECEKREPEQEIKSSNENSWDNALRNPQEPKDSVNVLNPLSLVTLFVAIVVGWTLPKFGFLIPLAVDFVFYSFIQFKKTRGMERLKTMGVWMKQLYQVKIPMCVIVIVIIHFIKNKMF